LLRKFVDGCQIVDSRQFRLLPWTCEEFITTGATAECRTDYWARLGAFMETRQLVVKPARAAQLLDMSKSKIYDAIHRGDVPAIRISGQLRVPVAAIERLIADQLAGDGRAE
jgi:excisionase family DNA binding protein